MHKISLTLGFAALSFYAQAQPALMYYPVSLGQTNPSGLSADLIGANYSDIAVADIDGDWDLDLLISGYTPQYQRQTSLYRNDGHDNYRLVENTPFPGIIDGDLVFADMDNDGDQDLFLTGNNNTSYDTIAYYKNGGSGNFIQQNVPALIPVTNASIEVFDANNDYRLDVFFMGTGPAPTYSKQSILLLQDANGDFNPSGYVFPGLSNGAVRAADVNGDGYKEILLTGWDDGSTPITRIFEYDDINDEYIVFTSLADLYNSDARFVDMNGDGDQDIILTGFDGGSQYFVRLYENTGSGSFIDISSNLPAGTAGVHNGGISVGNINGDALPDFVVTGADGASAPQTQLFTNTGNHGFSLYLLSAITDVHYGEPLLVDINADGLDDLLLAGQNPDFNATAELYMNQAAVLNRVQNPLPGALFGAATLGLLDGNTRPDLVLTGTTQQNDTLGNVYLWDPALEQFVFNATATDTVAPLHDGIVRFADFDRDGDDDLFVIGINNTGSWVSDLYENDGTGGLTPVPNFPVTPINSGSCIIQDFNGDLYPDIFITGTDAGGSRVGEFYSNAANGALLFNFIPNSFIGRSNGTAAAGDLNDDGNLDILVTGVDPTFTVTTEVYGGNGAGLFSAILSGVFPPVEQGSIAIADVNSDNKDDVLMTGQNAGVPFTGLYINQGSGVFNLQSGTPFPGVYNSTVEFLDANGDTFQDVLLMGLQSGSLSHTALYLGDGAGNFTELTPNPFHPVASGAFAIADIDGNSVPDFVISGRDENFIIRTDAYLGYSFSTFDLASLSTLKNGFSVTEFPNPVGNYTLSDAAVLGDQAWNFQNDLDDWYGISTYIHQGQIRVSNIELNNLNKFLNGLGYQLAYGNDLPDGIFANGAFEYLEKLEVANCRIQNGPTSPWFIASSGTPLLYKIDVSYNLFASPSGTVLSNIFAKFPNLLSAYAINFRDTLGGPTSMNTWFDQTDTIYCEIFKLHDNLLEGTLVLHPSKFPRLQEGYFQNNLLNDIYFANASHPSLYRLDVFQNNLAEGRALADVFSFSPALEHLDARSAMSETPINTTFDLSSANPASSELIFMDISENNLTGTLDLHYLLNHTPGTGTLMELHAQKNQFSNLYLDDNTLYDDVFLVDVSKNQIETPLPSAFFNKMPYLNSLYLNDNRFYGEFPAGLNGGFYDLVELEYLHLDSNALRGSLPLNRLFCSPNLGGLAPIRELHFENNSISEIEDLSTLSDFTPLYSLRAANNELDFYGLEDLLTSLDLATITLGNGAYHYVPTGWVDYNINAPSLGLLPIDTLEAFTYAPQKPVGEGGARQVLPGDSLAFATEIYHTELLQTFLPLSPVEYYFTRFDSLGNYQILATASYDYAQMSFDYNPTITSKDFFINGGDSILQRTFSAYTGAANYVIDTLTDYPLSQQFAYGIKTNSATPDWGTFYDEWYYTVYAVSDAFPMTTIQSDPKRILVGGCFDSLGTPIVCQQMFVQYQGGTVFDGAVDVTDSVKAALRDSLGVTSIEVCPCGDLELWHISDELYGNFLLSNGSGTRKVATTSGQTQSQLLSANPNYLLMNPVLPTNNAMNAQFPRSTSDSVRVAIIDAGVDYDHPLIAPHIMPDQAMTGDSCQLLQFGYSFVNRDSLPFDDYGHGTNVTGVLVGASDRAVTMAGSNNDELSIMPIKYTDAKGRGTLFHAVCGIYMAIRNGAKVVNASWGYEGEECPALLDALNFADTSDVLVVCAAGNDHRHNNLDSSYVHWPSTYNTPGWGISNLVSVAALDPVDSSMLSTYSNYSPVNVQIATWGDVETTAIDTDGTGALETVSGTSFAAPRVSRAIGLLRYYFPEASACQIKEALRLSVDTLENTAYSSLLFWKGRLNFDRAYEVLDSLLGVSSPCEVFVGTETLPDWNSGGKALTVYPNPFGNQLYLQWAQQSGNLPTSVAIYTLDGRLHDQFISNEALHTLSTQDWLPGIYVLRIQRGEELYVEKVVKY